MSQDCESSLDLYSDDGDHSCDSDEDPKDSSDRFTITISSFVKGLDEQNTVSLEHPAQSDDNHQNQSHDRGFD